MSNPQQNQPSMLKRFMPLIIFALLVVMLAVGLKLNPRLVPSPLIGKATPEFELPLLTREGSFSHKDFKNHITLLNVWASWCFACRQEHEVVTQLSNSGYRVIGFNYKDEPQNALAWLDQFGNPYQEVMKDVDGRIAIDWGVYGAPETFLIDRQGIIRHKVIGPLSSPENLDMLMKAIKQLKDVDV
jgi:cytochrome c biogenesis protein CcmG/thiol:disulfide interchange protein DsbE